MREKATIIFVCTLFLFSSCISLEFFISTAGRAENNVENVQNQQLSFAAFTDTHIGARYQMPLYAIADHLNHLGDDMVNFSTPLDFVIHLGDIVNHNTAQVNGQGLPWYVDQYRNNLKAWLISHVNLPFYYVVGNHDVTDYQMNRNDPHNLTRSVVDELSLNELVYAMMYKGILFLVVPELGYVTWTHPVEYQWITYMTSQYPTTSTIIFCHQAIEDTTKEESLTPYRGKQDMDWWATLFQNNPQILLWVHGHNHWPDWYVSDQSTGLTTPIRSFGHQMAFSSPYPQMDWGARGTLDRVVIYNVSSSGITTGRWENSGAGGYWISDYVHTWNTPTTFNPDAENWYAFPVFLQDNETQLTDMKVLSPNITLQLVGTTPMELFFDSRMESPNGSRTENILGFGNDQSGNVQWTNPGMHVNGPASLTFPEKYPDNASIQEDGRSGQPYQSFPMGTIAAAIPGQTYEFTMTARCTSGVGRINLNVSCSDWGTRSQYSLLAGSSTQVFSHTFGLCDETIHGTYTVPDNQNAWFLQGAVEFLDSTGYEVSLFSVKRQHTRNTTDEFHLNLSGHWYNSTGSLAENEHMNFSVAPQQLSDTEGMMHFTAFIQGNHYGMVNLVYREPILLGMNARFRINTHNDTIYTLSLTKTISRVLAEKMMIWESLFFQKFPYATELLFRLLMHGAVGRVLSSILERIHPEISTTFKMFPFSTNPLYTQVKIIADDASGMIHYGASGNTWFSCTGPDFSEKALTVTFPKR